MMIFRIGSLGLLAMATILTLFVPSPSVTARQRLVIVFLVLSAGCGAALAIFWP